MKKFFKVLICFLLIGMLSGCNFFVAKDKEFSEDGMTVTLTDKFLTEKNDQVEMYVTSNKHVFMGNGESKSILSLSGYSNLSLTGYAELVLSVSGKNSEVELYSDEDTEFGYAYYDATVDGENFSYMLVCMEGENKFYTMNFACLTKNFTDKTKEQYLEWAKTIRVE